MVILLFLSFGLLWWLSNLVLKPKKLSSDELYEREVAKKKFDSKAYQAMTKVRFNLNSDFGYPISCELLGEEKLKAKGSDKRIAVLCHGFTCAKCVSLIYADIFLKMGYAALIYDHRNHGQSGKAFTTMGYYEKYDLKKVIDWCYERYGPDIKVVTHGESMGAATVLLHLGIDDRVKCTIADCAYSDLEQLLRHQLKEYYHLPQFFVPLVNIITYLRAGFWYQQVSPIRVVRRAATPILFIHGRRDYFVPTYMSIQMYRSKKANKAIYLVEDAGHAESCMVNREEYRRRLKSFLDTYVS